MLKFMNLKRAAGMALVAAVAVTVLAPSAPAMADPPVDPYPSYSTPTCRSFVEQPGVVAFRAMLADHYGIGGGIHACSGYEHGEGRALDWMVNHFDPAQDAMASQVLNWLLATDGAGNPHAMARRLGIGNIIWNGRSIELWSYNGNKVWRKYSPCVPGSPAGVCHTNHIHFAFSWAGALQQTSWFTTYPRPSSWYPYGSGGSLNHLSFVKTRGVSSIEVHQSPNPYTGFDLHSASGLSAAEAGLGQFSMVDDKLVYVKTQATGSGKVELHWRTAASGFTSGYSTPTVFNLGDGPNGLFSLVGSDLVFIKIRNTGSGRVEVHKVSSANDYQSSPYLSVATLISVADAANGTFQMYGNDLVFIKSRNTGYGRVEVHVLDGSCGFCQWRIQAVSLFSQGEDTNGWFRYGDALGNDGIGDLIFIKTKNTGSGMVELFATSSSNGFTQFGMATATGFHPSDADNGWWGMNT